MTSANRQMMLVAFLQAQNCTNYTGSWRHPASRPDWGTAEYYKQLGRTLEFGKFHMAFFDDRLAMPDRYGGDFAASVENGIRTVKLDPMVAAMAVGLATERLGIGATYSTTYYEPFHVARIFATMDLLLGGRVAWNVVTSLNDSEAANFGSGEHLRHDLRYDRADEFMEVVMGHWDTWREGAILQDRGNGRFADPDAVKALNHRGKFFGSQGPFTVPRSAQGRPIIIQAGQSGRGKEFAARWAELVFTINPTLEAAKRYYGQMREIMTEYDGGSPSILPAIYTIVGETDAIAQEKRSLIESLAKPIDALALLSEALNYDFSKKRPDERFTDDDLSEINGLRGILDRVVHLSGSANPTLSDFVNFSKRGTIHEFPVFCGTGKTVADALERWFLGEACDGFVVAGTHSPGAYEDFVRLVIPELQRRGLFHKDYAGSTLRENLGIEKPGIGARRGRIEDGN